MRQRHLWHGKDGNVYGLKRIAERPNQVRTCRGLPPSRRRIVPVRGNEMPPPGQAASYLPIFVSYLPTVLCRHLQSSQTHLMLASEQAALMSRWGDCKAGAHLRRMGAAAGKLLLIDERLYEGDASRPMLRTCCVFLVRICRARPLSPLPQRC